MFCCNKRESPQFALSEVNSPRYEIAFIDLEFVDYSRGRTTFKWPFKGYLFFVQSVQDTYRTYNVVSGLFQSPYYAYSQTMMAELSLPGFDNMVNIFLMPPTLPSDR